MTQLTRAYTSFSLKDWSSYQHTGWDVAQGHGSWQLRRKGLRLKPIRTHFRVGDRPKPFQLIYLKT